MGRIRVLADHIINQIAAGEVIENPASVVKELVENAIDAGATQVNIETKAGGLQLIRVVDNGSGMAPDDALLCLERHATSKIAAADDLFALSTMGFRGEALASIASISKLTLVTCHETGTMIEVEGGKILSVQPCARTRGTTVEVRSLFYNVPARKKFQKAATVCGSEVSRVIASLSLAHPEVGFELIQQDRCSLKVPSAAALIERVGQVLGEPFCQGLSPIELQENGFELRGFMGMPHHTRLNRTGQHLYINKRPVVSPLVSSAVREGYGTRLGSDRHPVFVLHVALQPTFVDVNVHPQKKEVRFREEVWLKDLVRRAVSEALQGEASGPASVLAPFSFPSFQEQQFSFAPPSSTFFDAPLVFREDVPRCETAELPFEVKRRVIGLYAHFLFLEGSTGEAIFVDLHAALAQIAFDQLLKPVKKSSQGLLVPLTLELSSAEAEAVTAQLSLFEEMGIGIRPLSSNAFIIDALPPFLDTEDALEAVREMSETLRRDIREEKLAKLAKIASSYTKKKMFSVFEAEAVYDQLLATSSPKFAPDGRPTMAQINKEALASFLMRHA